MERFVEDSSFYFFSCSESSHWNFGTDVQLKTRLCYAPAAGPLLLVFLSLLHSLRGFDYMHMMMISKGIRIPSVQSLLWIV